MKWNKRSYTRENEKQEEQQKPARKPEPKNKTIWQVEGESRELYILR